jgi:hypothetical protein
VEVAQNRGVVKKSALAFSDYSYAGSKALLQWYFFCPLWFLNIHVHVEGLPAVACPFTHSFSTACFISVQRISQSEAEGSGSLNSQSPLFRPSASPELAAPDHYFTSY